MKKITHFCITGLLLSIVLLTGSCKKYLEEGPITSTYDQKFWTSQNSVEQATVAMYSQLRASFRDEGIDYNNSSYFVFGDFTAGLFNPSSGDWNLSDISPSNGSYFKYAPYLEGALWNWSRFYRLIAQSNLILERVPLMQASAFTSEEKRNQYIAEALFMRAFTYFYVVRVWGDAPYINKTYNDIDYGNIPPVGRTAESIVLDSCIADLTRAAGYVDFSGGDPTQTIRANKGSVNALLAHIYAWKHDYANAHNACMEVLNNGGYSLEPAENMKNVWDGQSSSESIFELPLKFNANGVEQNFDFFGIFLKDEFVEDRKNTSWIIPKDNAETLYSADDERFKNLLFKVDASGGDVEGYMMTKYANFEYLSSAPNDKNQTYISNNLVIFRLADIKLLDAEALAMQDKYSEAKTLLDEIRQRAGTGDYSGALDKEALVKEIVLERQRELVGEGSNYYDMIRTNDVAHMLSETLFYSSDRINLKGYYWPIDMGALFATDPLLTQNPWWSAN